MSDLNKFNYECEEQMSLFDLPEFEQKESIPNTLANECKECEAYPQGCGGMIGACRWDGPYKWSEVMK